MFHLVFILLASLIADGYNNYKIMKDPFEVMPHVASVHKRIWKSRGNYTFTIESWDTCTFYQEHAQEATNVRNIQ